MEDKLDKIIELLEEINSKLENKKNINNIGKERNLLTKQDLIEAAKRK